MKWYLGVCILEFLASTGDIEREPAERISSEEILCSEMEAILLQTSSTPVSDLTFARCCVICFPFSQTRIWFPVGLANSSSKLMSERCSVFRNVCPCSCKIYRKTASNISFCRSFHFHSCALKQLMSLILFDLQFCCVKQMFMLVKSFLHPIWNLQGW